MRVRLLGVTASNLGEREQLGLFAADDPRGGRRSRRPTRVASALRVASRDPGAAGRDAVCRRRSSATRATRSTAGRGACRSSRRRRRSEAAARP